MQRKPKNLTFEPTNFFILMKHIFTFLLLFPLVVSAQWTNNPGTPLRVCTTNSNQYGPWIFPDGSSGQYIFWLDDRAEATNPSDVKLFAQHLDQNGNRLFHDTGKMIVDHPTLKTADFSINRDGQGKFWISWGMTTSIRLDSIVIRKFDDVSLNPIWPTSKTIARIATDFNVTGLTSMQIIPTADSVSLLYMVTWMGGSTYKFINRVSANGNVRFGNGKTFTGYNQNYGSSTALINPDGTLFLIQRNANAAGSRVNAWKFDKKMNRNWGPKSLVPAPGLGGNSFNIVSDGANGFVMAYVRANGDIIATRVDSAGNFVWTPAQRPICDHSSQQNSPEITKVDNNLYCVWTDNRPPANNSDIYMQKLDLMGNQLWNPKGRVVFRLNSYIPVPRIFPAADGNLIVASHHSTIGFVAQKVRPDSSFVWPGYGLLIASGNTLTPSYGSFGLSAGANGNTFVAWQGFSAKIYVAGVAENGTLLTSIEDRIEKGNGLKIYPNPAKDMVQIEGLDPKVANQIAIFDAAGRKVFHQVIQAGQTSAQINPPLPKGYFWLRVGNKTLPIIRE